ncbi:DUF937 domain-containing protein [Isoptericola sp. NPDC056573]|uniref:DUF937 domain-containing protein n=1 Tax=unclassified Isoptericola TaxID=2623355 RepID=UPI0036A605AC
MPASMPGAASGGAAGASIDDLLAEIPIDQIAGQLGVDAEQAQRAVGGALPALFGGLKANADDPAGAASLAGALSQHDPGLVEGGIDVAQVDTADGEKIVDHVFGANKDQVVAQLSGAAGTDSGVLQKLLPILAPLALSFLSKKLGGGQATASGEPAEGSAGGGLGDLLGGLLGGGGSAGGLDVGGLLGSLGGLLGGGRR